MKLTQYSNEQNYSLEKNIKLKQKTKTNTNNKLNSVYSYFIHPYLISRKNKPKSNIIKTKETNLNKIDKLFEGRYPETKETMDLYKYLSILKYTLNTYTNVTLYNVDVLNIEKSVNNLCYSSDSKFKKGLIAFPLSLYDVSNVNNYIYYIQKYTYINNNKNNYRSSFISLFYYFIGLFLAIFSLYSYNNIKILYSNLIIIVSKLSSFIIFNKIHKIELKYTKIESIKFISIINNSFLLASTTKLIKYNPYLTGLTRYTMYTSCILSKLSFRETLRTLKSVITHNKVDWCVDIKSNLITSNFIPVGSGWYRYFQNKTHNDFKF
ncbi:putative integral membrane protein (apicoplast) [Babesia bovis T2Bo]|uniref:Uncharacterized protein n=1 Tax=Babesia bovis TaxID=5865 RepID=A7AXE2_BABBO|nr:putative integral membrane protein [Babesia bovis T2Bo]EDO05065.1 putative integral membrane protein [Babesia bovis T2Bo]|eukprot:YP_002290845.1 hypothetical protein BBOV_V000100 (apicoplast) [Babesia bovis T2Bo]